MIKIAECIFCKIAQGKMESETIYETDDVICFLDINPRAPGHCLVIPKEHTENLIDLEDRSIGAIFKAVKKVEKMLKASLDPDAFTIGINDGEAAGQEIPHLHVNIIPRFKGDKGKAIHSVVNNPPEEDVSEIADMVREASKDL